MSEFTTCDASEDGACYFSADIAKLTAERDALKAELREREDLVSILEDERDRLRAEVADARKRLDMSELGVNNLGTQLTELREAAEAYVAVAPWSDDAADQREALRAVLAKLTP